METRHLKWGSSAAETSARSASRDWRHFRSLRSCSRTGRVSMKTWTSFFISSKDLKREKWRLREIDVPPLFSFTLKLLKTENSEGAAVSTQLDPLSS